MIKSFDNFNSSNILYVFDLDDTLVKTPKFGELAIEFLKENKSIEDILSSCMSDLNVEISDLKWENGRVFVDDPEGKIEIPNGINWLRKGKRIYLLTPDNFNMEKISLPTAIREDIVELYNSVENKCIITARGLEIKDDIINILSNLGLEYPKFGLHLYPNKNHFLIGQWKGNKMIEIAKENSFNSITFYDDNAKYIKGAKKVIDTTNLIFKAIKV